jgi:hypothetical protein
VERSSIFFSRYSPSATLSQNFVHQNGDGSDNSAFFAHFLAPENGGRTKTEPRTGPENAFFSES